MRTAPRYAPQSSSVSIVPMQARTLGRCLQEFQETLQLYQSYGLSWSYLASFTSNPSSTVWSMTSSSSTVGSKTTVSTGNSSVDRALQWATPSATVCETSAPEASSSWSLRSTSWPRSMDVRTGGMFLSVPASSEVKSVTYFQRDYMLDQDGFEDWSWLCDQRPYDSLVRESLSDSFATFAPDAPVAALEHLGNEELSNSYATKLRSTQQMKWFTQSSRVASEGVESPWFVLNEQRADRLLWNQGWFVSQAQARQMLQHKKIGILRAKDKEAWRRDSDASLATYASIASPRTFVKPGDILYWRGSGPKTSLVDTSQRLNHYTFPSSLHVGSTPSTMTPSIPMIHSPHLSVHVNQTTLTSCLTSSEQGMGSQASSNTSSWLWDHALYPYCVRSQRVLCRDLVRLPQSLLAT